MQERSQRVGHDCTTNFHFSQHQSFPMSRLFTSGGQSIGASTKKKNVIYLKLYFIWQPCSWGPKVLGLSGSPVCVFRLVTSSLEPVGTSCFIIVLPHPSLFHCERIVCQFWNKESVDIKITNEYKSNILSPSFSSLRHGNAPVKLMQLLTWRTNSSLQELKPINCFFMYS